MKTNRNHFENHTQPSRRASPRGYERHLRRRARSDEQTLEAHFERREAKERTRVREGEREAAFDGAFLEHAPESGVDF